MTAAARRRPTTGPGRRTRPVMGEPKVRPRSADDVAAASVVRPKDAVQRPAASQNSLTSDESPLRSALSVLTNLGPPLTIATALMFYFGWARSDAQARYMGLDVSLF